jgi:hypothetical protein
MENIDTVDEQGRTRPPSWSAEGGLPAWLKLRRTRWVKNAPDALYFTGDSAQVVVINTPAYIDSNHAADAANREAGHDSKSGSYPPSNPAKDGHADEDTKPAHNFSNSN